MKRAILAFTVVALLGIACVGCKGTDTATAGPTPLPTSSNRAGLYDLAFGDDATVGIGSSDCGTNITTTPCSSSAGAPGTSSSLNPHGWSQLLAYYLQLPRFQPSAYFGIGVTGALTVKAPLLEGAAGDIQSNTGQFGGLAGITGVPRAQNIKMLITFQGGINDVLDAFYSQQCVATGGTVKGGGSATITSPCTASNMNFADASGNIKNGVYYIGVRSMFATLQGTVGGPPEATVIVGVPDVGRLPIFAAFTAAQKAQLTQYSQLANQSLQQGLTDSTLQNAVFIDYYTYLASNPQYYGSLYFSADGFHSSDSGYAVLEGIVQPAIASNFPTLSLLRAGGR